ncbi:MAG: PucR family transcriptional regulator ligand-binding domain-containing protein [Actinobacteria bacterium]|nr:PucR family transcriptional regulator ligand-binding domain-containing protein [Actinomycetota bacterium]
MPLFLPELLDDVGLGLALVAGHAGVGARGAIRWAHISDTPDPTPWLEGGEILLTTGLGVKDAPELQRRLVGNLHDRGCVAIGFGLGVTLAAVPEAMLEACDELALPLFTVPLEVPFIAVTRRVARAVFDEHFATLRDAVDLHRKVLSTVISGGGLGAVLETTSTHMPDVGLLVFDFAGTLLATHAGTTGLAPGDVWDAVSPAHVGRDRATTRVGACTVTSAVVREGDEIEAVLAVVADRDLHEHEQLLVEQVLAGLGLELARGQSVRENRRVRVDELLEEAMAGRASTQMITRVVARLGGDPEAGYRALCLRRPRGVGERALCTTVEDVLAGQGSPIIVGRHDRDVYALVPAGADVLADHLVKATRGRGWAGVTVGRSREKTTLDALPAALREARTAAHIPIDETGAVRDVDAIGLEGVLAGLRSGTGAEHFVDHILGPVLAYDERENAQLVESLRAYLRHGCRPGPAADELSIHRHTLSYRLDRIRELTGRDPRDGAHLLEWTLALELVDGLGGPGGSQA